jgi:hypothetical protein
MRVLYSFFCARVCCTNGSNNKRPRNDTSTISIFPPSLSFILLPITITPYKLEPFRCVFPFRNRCVNSRPSFSVFQKMCDGEKKAKQWQQVCLLLLLCGNRGAACGFLKCWVCVCRNTHKNSNGDLGRYAAPAVPAMKTLLGRNRCPLAGFTIGKQHWKLAAFRLECDWFSRNGERNKCLTGRKNNTTDCYLKLVKLTLLNVVCHFESGNLQEMQM